MRDAAIHAYAWIKEADIDLKEWIISLIFLKKLNSLIHFYIFTFIFQN